MIVQLLRDVGDEWDEEVRSQGEVEVSGLDASSPSSSSSHFPSSSLSPPPLPLLPLLLALQVSQHPSTWTLSPPCLGTPCSTWVLLSFLGSSPLSSSSGTWPSFAHAPYNFKALSEKWLHNTQPQSSGRNPRRESLTSRDPLLIRSMALRSPGEQGL